MHKASPAPIWSSSVPCPHHSIANVSGNTDSLTLGKWAGRLLRRTPLFGVAVLLALGIVLSECIPSPSVVVLLVAVVLGLAAMAATVVFRSPQWTFRLSVGVALTAVGWLLPLLHAPHDPFGVEIEQAKEVTTFSVRLCDTPRTTDKCYKVVAEVTHLFREEGWQPVRGKVMLFVRQDSLSSTLHYGQHLLVRACPRRPNGADYPGQFDYRRYLRRQGVLWQCYVPCEGWQFSSRVESVGLVGWSKTLQQRLVQRLHRSPLTPWQQGVAEALLLGWRNDVDDTARQQFRNAGITHLLCVSGLHVGIMAWLVGACLLMGRRRGQRIVKGLFQMAAIWFYVLLTGLAPATLRAGIMFSMLLVGDMLEQRPNTLNNLCASAILLLLFRPMWLFDVGFQLSYTAVLGIVAWNRPMQDLLPILAEPYPKWYLYLPSRLWQWVCLSTSAQLATLPWVLLYFHQFPTYFLLANVTIVPFAGVLLATAGVALLCVGLPGIGTVAARLLSWELGCIDGLTHWIGTLPWALLEHLYFDHPMCVMLFLALLFFTLLLCVRRLWAMPFVMGCLLLMTLYGVVVNVHASRQHEVVCYQSGRAEAVECFVGRRSYLVCDSLTARHPERLSYQRDGVLLVRRIRETMVLPCDTTFRDPYCVVRNGYVAFGDTLICVPSKTDYRFSRM